jgi:hypothetical protein
MLVVRRTVVVYLDLRRWESVGELEERGGGRILREASKERGKSMWVMPSYLQKCTVKGAVRSGGVEM